MHRTMYILDVISGVSRSSKCTKIVGGWGFAPDTTGGADSAPRLLAGFKGAYFKAPLNPARREEEGRQNYLCPGRLKNSRHNCLSEVRQGALEHWFTGRGLNLKLRHC